MNQWKQSAENQLRILLLGSQGMCVYSPEGCLNRLTAYLPSDLSAGFVCCEKNKKISVRPVPWYHHLPDLQVTRGGWWEWRMGWCIATYTSIHSLTHILSKTTHTEPNPHAPKKPAVPVRRSQHCARQVLSELAHAEVYRSCFHSEQQFEWTQP